MFSESMIFECRTYDPNGKLKGVMSREECMRHFYRGVEGVKFDNLKPKAKKKWSKEINCIICGDKVKVFSQRGVKCKKKACATEWRKLKETQRGGRKSEILSHG